MPESAAAAVDRVFRADRARVLAALIRGLGDFELAEDALSEAFASAMRHWDTDGVPRDPAAWLVTVGRRAGLDRIRRARVGAAKYAQVAREERERPVDEGPEGLVRVGDDRLSLVFTCCHPALDPQVRAALTLQAVGGLTAGADRQGVPGQRGHHGAAPRAGQAEDPRRRDPVRGARGRRAPRPPLHRTRRHLPDLHRGIPRDRGGRPDDPRPVCRGHPAGQAAGRC